MAQSSWLCERDKCPCGLITLRIKFPKKEVKVGEEVKWQVEFANKSGRPITFYWKCDPESEFLTITIREGSRVFIIDPSRLSPFSAEWQAYTLQPGESRSRECIFWEDEPGEYEIGAEFHYLGIRVKAEPVVVKVVPAK